MTVMTERVLALRKRAAIETYRARRTAFFKAAEAADAAFLRWFTKRQNGEPTNAAAATRLANLTSYASADLAVAEGALYALDIDSRDVDREDGVEVVQ